MSDRASEPLRLLIKAVPGAKTDEIVGPLGDRLKIRISAPPEAGKANAAICALIAKALKIHERNITIISGHTRPEKTLEITGADPAALARLLSPR